MRLLRHQLATYSPVRLRDILAAVSSRAGEDPASRLSAMLSTEFGAPGVLLLDSGTHALQAVLEQTADRARLVALPAFNCFDLATAAIGAGVRVVLYDVDPDTLSPDGDSLLAAIRAGAGTIVVAPLYGVPVDWDTLTQIAEAHDVLLIEDAAQGSGASWRGKPLGSLGDASVLSFQRGKGWTGGRGGALLVRTRDVPAAPTHRAGELGSITRLLAQWALGRPSVYGIPRRLPWLHLGETAYVPPSTPQGLSRGAAAALLSSWHRAAEEARLRRERAARLVAALPPHLRYPGVPPHAVAGYIRFPVRLPGRMDFFRDRAKAKRLGIAPSYPSPLSDLAALQRFIERTSSSFPGADTLAAELVTLPTHSRITYAEEAEILSLLSR